MNAKSEFESIELDRWEQAKRGSSIACAMEQAVIDLMKGQMFDEGNHLISRIAPSHSAVVKARMLLSRVEKPTKDKIP
jgi:hypothetical protein